MPEDSKLPIFKPIPKKVAKPVPVEVLCAYADMIGDQEEKKQEFDPPPWEDDEDNWEDDSLNRFW